jgi:C4-dicarboxylate-specific signal transduction histidine kinase
LVRHELLNNRISLQMEPMPAPPAVLGDRVQLQQVLLNLIMNGIEAMRTAEDTKELTVLSILTGTGSVLVVAADTARG